MAMACRKRSEININSISGGSVISDISEKMAKNWRWRVAKAEKKKKKAGGIKTV